MGCIKKYYAANGEESALFGDLSELYGEAKAEEIYLRLSAGNFQEFFQKEKTSQVDLNPVSEVIKSKIGILAERTPFLNDIQKIGTVEQYGKYLTAMLSQSVLTDIAWSEPSDRTANPNSLKSTIESSVSRNLIGGLEYFVQASEVPKNLRDAQPHILFINEPYITNSYYKDQKEWDDNYTYHYVNSLLESGFDSIVRQDGSNISTIALMDGEKLRLGSPEDIAMFRDWVRSNPLDGPTYKTRIPKFDAKGSVYDSNGEPRVDIVTNPSMLNQIMGIRLQKMSAAEIASNLLSSAEGKIGEARGPVYPVNGKEVNRVSTILDRREFAPYVGAAAGQPYEEKGTRYHAIVEDLINGKSIAEVSAKHTVLPQEMGFINSMTRFIKQRKAMGGVLISELKVASMDADNGNGIVGTIDIIHILPNGRAVIFDIKTANNTERVQRSGKNIWDLTHDSNYKARRYTYQTMLYGALLEKGDATTGRVPVPVDGIYVIPIEVTYGDDLNDVVTVNMINPQDIKTHESWRQQGKKKTFYDKFKPQIENLVYGTAPVTKKSKIKADIDGQTVTDFLKSAIGVGSGSPAATSRQRAINYVERVSPDSKTFTVPGINTQFKWDSADREARIVQLQKIFEKQDSNHGIIATDELADYYRNGYKNAETDSPSYSYDINSKSQIVAARTQRINQIFDSAGATRVEVLGNHEGVVLIHRSDGTYDILTLSNIALDTEIPIANRAPALYRAMGGRKEFNSLFGNYLTPLDSNNKRVTLQNTHGDYERLRLGLIALELTAKNPGMKINRVIVDQMNGTSTIFPRVAPMKEIVHNIKVMHSIPEIKNQEPSEIKEILDDDAIFDPMLYGDDPLKDLLDYLTTTLEDSKDSKKLVEEIEKFEKKQIKADELAEQLLEGSAGIIRMIRNENRGTTPKEQMDAVSADPLFQTLSRAYISLKGYGFSPDADITNRFAGDFMKWVMNPTMTGNRILDKFTDIFRVHVNRIKQKMDAFTREKDPVVRALVEEDPMYKRGFSAGLPPSYNEKSYLGTDALFGMGRTIFDDLLVTKTDAKGNKYRLPQLKAKGTAEYNKLSKAQQNFIDYFNRTMKKYNPEWVENAIPIIQVSSDTKAFRAKQAITKGDLRKAAGDYRDSISTFWKMAANKGNFLTEAEAPRAFSDTAYDAFAGQLVKDGEGAFTTKSLARIGLDGGMNLIDADLNETFETDLEKVMSLFALSYIRKDEMKQALPKYHVFRSALKYVEVAYGATSDGTSSQEDAIETMDEYVQDLAFNLKQGEDKVISKFFNVSIQLSSIALIGLNPKVFIGNTAQMTLSGGMDAFINTLVKDPRFAGLTEYSKAWGILAQAKVNPGLARKIHYLRRMYMPDDTARFTSDKHMVSARGVITQQTAFLIDNMIELGFKEHFLVAQMLKDGVWDAHNIVSETSKEDGYTRYRVVYDPKKDPRFTGKDGQAFYDTLKKSMVETGEIAENEEIKSAYDYRLRERLKAYIARNIGTHDRDLSSKWSRYALFHALSQFRNWFRDKFQRLTIKEFDSEIFGDYVKSKDGQYAWSNEPMKGALRTLADLILMPSDMYNLMKKGELSREDQKNLYYMGTSLVTMGTLFLLMLAMFNDDDDEEFSIAKVALTAAQNEVLNSFTLSPFTRMTVDPFVFTSFYDDLLKKTVKIMHYGLEGDWTKGYNTFKSALPVIKQFPIPDEE